MDAVLFLWLLLLSFTSKAHILEENANSKLQKNASSINYFYNHGKKELSYVPTVTNTFIINNSSKISADNRIFNISRINTTSNSSTLNSTTTTPTMEEGNRIIQLMKVLVENNYMNMTLRLNNSKMIQWPPKNSTHTKVESGICGWKVITKPTKASHIQKIKIKKITKVANVVVNEDVREVICCDGYERKNGTYCIPICQGNCLGGTCIAPGRCRCPPETVLSLGGACVPICPSSCLNGQCIGDLCFCDDGFIIDESGQLCKPLCGSPYLCKLGNCSAPGVCECSLGYHLQDGNCVPTCPGGCLNGQCVAPNDCHCLPGFHHYLANACKKHCMPDSCGLHGHCMDMFHCRCDPGWRIDAETGRCIEDYSIN